MGSKLSRAFYRQDTTSVARKLIGKRLVHLVNGRRLAGIIVETEAYLGINDPACHTYGGRVTPRTHAMYLNGGHSYVYRIYGMYLCFNVVTRTTQHPEAVLIRAVEPEAGLALAHMQLLRPVKSLTDLASGPAKLCQAMGIDIECNTLDLLDSKLWIENAKRIRTDQIIARPRIGIDYAGPARKWPLRFYWQGNPHISKP